MAEKETVRTIPDDTTPEQLAQQLTAESETERTGGEPEQPKRKRGRPPGSKTRKRGTTGSRAKGNGIVADPEPDDTPDAPELTPEQQAELMQAATQQIAPVVHGLLAPAIRKRTPENPYTLQEAATFTGAALPVAAKYGSGMLLRFMPEIMLAGIIAQQVFNRPETPQPSGVDVTALVTRGNA